MPAIFMAGFLMRNEYDYFLYFIGSGSCRARAAAIQCAGVAKDNQYYFAGSSRVISSRADLEVWNRLCTLA
jgi:hypothetical protein